MRFAQWFFLLAAFSGLSITARAAAPMYLDRVVCDGKPVQSLPIASEMFLPREQQIGGTCFAYVAAKSLVAARFLHTGKLESISPEFLAVYLHGRLDEQHRGSRNIDFRVEVSLNRNAPSPEDLPVYYSGGSVRDTIRDAILSGVVTQNSPTLRKKFQILNEQHRISVEGENGQGFFGRLLLPKKDEVNAAHDIKLQRRAWLNFLKKNGHLERGWFRNYRSIKIYARNDYSPESEDDYIRIESELNPYIGFHVYGDVLENLVDKMMKFICRRVPLAIGIRERALEHQLLATKEFVRSPVDSEGALHAVISNGGVEVKDGRVYIYVENSNLETMVRGEDGKFRIEKTTGLSRFALDSAQDLIEVSVTLPPKKKKI